MQNKLSIIIHSAEVFIHTSVTDTNTDMQREQGNSSLDSSTKDTKGFDYLSTKTTDSIGNLADIHHEKANLIKDGITEKLLQVQENLQKQSTTQFDSVNNFMSDPKPVFLSTPS